MYKRQDLERVAKEGEPNDGSGFVDINGKNVVVFDDDGNPTDQNITKEGVLVLDQNLVGKLEAQLGGELDKYSGGGNPKLTIKNLTSTFKGVISTLFHEGVHFGRNDTGAGNKGVDRGAEFEKKAFGENVSSPSAEELEE